MTEERQKKINQWCEEHCPNCEYCNEDGCQLENEVIKDTGIACIHFENKSEEG